MKLKLDESLPATATEVLRHAGHDVATALEEDLGGAADAEIATAAAEEGRILLTLDRGMADPRSNRPGTHPGIAVFRLHAQDARTIVRAVELFVQAAEAADVDGCNVIVEPARFRVRRPRRG